MAFALFPFAFGNGMAGSMDDAMAARARVQAELAKLEAAQAGHAATREQAEKELHKLEGDAEFHVKADSSEARERVKAELAKLDAMHEEHGHEKMLQDSNAARERAREELAKLESAHDAVPQHEEEIRAKAEAARKNARAELAKLEHKHAFIETKASTADAKQRVMAELAKLEKHHEDAAHAKIAQKGLNLKKDAPPKRGMMSSLFGKKVAEEAVNEEEADAGAAVNLMQRSASLLLKKPKPLLAKRSRRAEEL